MNLKGIAWDHPRGYQPLIACSEAFSEKFPNVKITWDVRTLKEFGDMPIEELITEYDLITIDHPYMGQANENELLVPLDDYVPESVLNNLAEESVGPSFNSYIYEKLYALPIDAAAQVSAFKKEPFEYLDLVIPKTRTELKKFHKQLPSGFYYIWPMCSVDAICSFLTLGAQENVNEFVSNRKLDKKITIKVIDELKYHLQYVHPESINENPINSLNRMSNSEEVVYAPYLFGYTNYSRLENNGGKIIDYRIPIKIGNVNINSGDLIFGDRDGVLVIPKALEKEVFSGAIEKARGEQLVRKALEEGMSTVDVFEKFGIM